MPEPTQTTASPASPRPNTTARVAGGAAARGQSLREKADGLTHGNTILVVMLAAAGGVLYWISQPRMAEKASAETQTAELRVNAALTHLGNPNANIGDGGANVKTLVGAFYEQAKDRQIPPGQLTTNPFVQVIAQAPPPTKPEPPKKVKPKVAPKPVLPDAASLQLKTVLLGPRGNSAMIETGSGMPEIVAEGQTIHGWTVEKIHPRKVVLRFKEHTHELLLPE